MSVSTVMGSSSATEIGPPAPLFSIRLAYGTNTGLPVPNYAVAPDGQRSLMNVLTRDSTPAPITVMVNWMPEGRSAGYQ